MNIAIVVPTQWYSGDPSLFSVDLSLYVQAAATIGHSALVVCREGSRYQVNFPVVAASAASYEDADFWRGLDVQMAIVFTWLHQARLVKTIRRAGIFVVSRGDTDGLFSIRQNPRLHLANALVSHKGLDKARAAKHWLTRYVSRYRREERAVIECIAQAHMTVVETTAAQRHVCRFLDGRRIALLKEKLVVLPHLVSEDILRMPVPVQKCERIAAIGRWDAPQKDGGLLRDCLERYLAGRPETEVVLIGAGGDSLFANLCRRYPKVRYVGAVPRAEVKTHLAAARIILSSSRWEGSPVSVNEALALGCTVVGPDIPGIAGICDLGDYGSVALRRSPTALAAALEQEMKRWDDGKRSSEQIAPHWRAYLSGTRILTAMCDARTRYWHDQRGFEAAARLAGERL